MCTPQQCIGVYTPQQCIGVYTPQQCIGVYTPQQCIMSVHTSTVYWSAHISTVHYECTHLNSVVECTHLNSVLECTLLNSVLECTHLNSVCVHISTIILCIEYDLWNFHHCMSDMHIVQNVQVSAKSSNSQDIHLLFIYFVPIIFSFWRQVFNARPVLDNLVGAGQMITYPLRIWTIQHCGVCIAIHSTEQCVNTDIRF